jgi:glycosyltransferase involved in cell wall biosynthesis
MSRLPRLTIITPSYNQGQYIEQTIRSVIDQGYPDLEYIVIDGASRDHTLETLLHYDRWLSWRSEPDRGQAHALNKGLRMATGDVIAFINSDDTYAPGALLEVGRLFATNPDATWLTGRCRTIDQAGNEIRRPITQYKNAWLRVGTYRVLNVLNFVSQPATFWRRSVVETTGPFDESLRYAMVYDYHLRVWSRFKPLIVNEYLANFRVHPESMAGSSANAQFNTDMDIVRRHTNSRVLLSMHAAHNAAAVATHRMLMRSTKSAPASTEGR